MAGLLEREQAAEQHVLALLNSPDQPIRNVLDALATYRSLCEAVVFANFQNAEHVELRLWQVHTESKKYFHRALSALRKKSGDQPVETRQLMRLYLEFLKHSQRYYRGYISRLSTASGGIPELQAIAQRIKADGSGESQQPSIPAHLHKQVLNSCHLTLIYLGDLSRYRASEKLDKNPDFGPAIGYYDLACSLRPSSGLGHHQQAVVALEQRQHMRAIYHLYRAMTVESPHPNAAQNLQLEFDKTNAAWDQGELIQKGPPNDPEAPKRAMVGWFVRLHSMCFKGESFRSYAELEREVLGRMTNEIKQRPLDATLMRMVLINIAAQYTSGERFQANPTQPHQDSFLHFFRFNLRTFATLLQVFHDDLGVHVRAFNNEETALPAKLTTTSHRILPCLRLYSNWLLTMVHMVAGLSSDAVVGEAVEQFWPRYAKAVDLVAQAFPIWDLEDLPEVSYMLEEDVDTIGFKPLSDKRTAKTWYAKSTGALKPRFSDRDTVRVSPENELLERVKEFLVDGLFLAHDDEQAPIKLHGTRVFYGDESQLETLFPSAAEPAPASVNAPPQMEMEPTPKPTSYASVAASVPVRAPGPAVPAARPAPPAVTMSRDAQLSRMVDDLVDDDDDINTSHPATPPQLHNSNPAVVAPGEMPRDGAAPQDGGPASKFPSTSFRAAFAAAAGVPERVSPQDGFRATHARMQSVSRLWDEPAVPASPTSPSIPHGLSMQTLATAAPAPSSAAIAGSGAGQHSRVNSVSSVRSRTSQVGDSWRPASITADPDAPHPPVGPDPVKTAASPLLFGAGGGLWSTGVWSAAARNVSPTSGPGG